MFKEIRDTLATGDNVYVRGFGSFIVKKRARKVGRNIQQNTTVDIPEHYVPAFKPAQTFIDQIKEEVLPANMDKKKKKK